MTEDELQEHVRGLCTDLGLHLFHARDSRRSMGPGFPDLVIAGLGGVLFRELKQQQEELSRVQRQWGYVLTAGGADFEVWRPADLRPRAGQPTGVIQSQLLRVAKIRQVKPA